MAGNDDRGSGASRAPEQTSRRGDLAGFVIAAALFVGAAMIGLDAFSYPERSSYANFGPEIFPYIVAAGFAVFAVLTAVMAARCDFPERDSLYAGPVLWISAALIVQTVLLYAGSGFVIASGVLFGGTARGFGRRPIALTLAVGLLLSVLLYVLFRQGLGLSLPSGLIEPYLDRLFR